MAVLVTGGAGFIGSHLAMGLKAHREQRVIALDSLKRRGSELNLPRLREAGVEFMHGDIRNPEDLDAVEDVEVIIECSAEPSVLAGFHGSPEYLIHTNLAGTANCLELARRRGAAVLFLSTSRVYPFEAIARLSLREDATRYSLADTQPVAGASAEGIAEEFPLDGPRSLYGATKLCSELLVTEYVHAYGLKAVVNRCGVVAGPWQMGKVDQGVVVLWMARHMFGGRLSYIGFGGHGKQVRDVLHVDDLLRLVMYQLDHLDALSGRTFNVGGGLFSSISLLELTEMCQAISGKKVAIGCDPVERPADIPLYITDHRRVTACTGWSPQKDMQAILSDIHAWIVAHRDRLEPILGQ